MAPKAGAFGYFLRDRSSTPLEGGRILEFREQLRFLFLVFCIRQDAFVMEGF